MLSFEDAKQAGSFLLCLLVNIESHEPLETFFDVVLLQILSMSQGLWFGLGPAKL